MSPLSDKKNISLQRLIKQNEFIFRVHMNSYRLIHLLYFRSFIFFIKNTDIQIHLYLFLRNKKIMNFNQIE